VPLRTINSRLIVEGFGKCAAIGAGIDNYASCGNIVIDGGIIEATAGEGAAAIGSGKWNRGILASCGNITITSGIGSLKTVIKKGYVFVGADSISTCGSVTIGEEKTGSITTESPYLKNDTISNFVSVLKDSRTWILSPKP